jgi:hypothetical protein
MNTSLLEPEVQTGDADDIPILSGSAASTGPKSKMPVIYWSWACRKITSLQGLVLEDPVLPRPPSPGDVALVRVERTDNEEYITTAENRHLRLYPGVLFAGVFGHRYAADSFEAEVQGLDNLSMLTDAGLIGTVKSKHHQAPEPVRVSFVGFLRDAGVERLNLKRRFFQPAVTRRLPCNLIYIVGTGVNSGKTTTAARLTNGLCNLGLSVAVCKLTGSVSNLDPDELSAAASYQAIDFSHFGFPSTYQCRKDELVELFHAMVTELTLRNPDVALMELADGLLQRETALLLAEPEIQDAACGVILAAENTISALCGTERLRTLGFRVVAVSGRFTSSPLAMREYRENHSPIPVLSSADTGDALAARVRDFLNDD